ncbi:hypothetical protein FOA52_006343 [Chlamydomonas sp. UWO 241]|nr:hypothetical protein FOA52_006343 [Chlamydomonas sp. UWO 241]
MGDAPEPLLPPPLCDEQTKLLDEHEAGSCPDIDIGVIESCQVEVLRQPNLAGRPIAIQQHQDVISVNYAARAAGVRKHMTPAQARTVLARVGGSLVHVFCEDGHRVSYRPYREMSQALMRLMKSFPASAVVQKASIDEAYISMVQQPDSSASVATGVRLAEEIRAAARRDLGLVVSVSIAPNPLLAKLASAASKPDGLLVLCDRPDEVERLLSSTPVDRLPGVGPRLAESLRAAGYAFARELSRTSPSHLSDAVVGGVKPELAVRLVEMGSGRDATPVVDKGPAKSIQVQMTLTPTPLPAPSSRAHERPVAGGLSDRGMLMPLLVGSAECEARLRGLLRAMAGDLCSRALMDRHLEARWPGKLGLQLITHGPSGKTTSKSTAFPAAALADAPGSSGGGGGGSSGGMAGRGGDGDCSGGGGSGVGGGGGGAAGRGGDRDGGGGGGGGGSSGGGGGSNGAGTCTSGGRDECGSLGSAAAAQLPPSSAASTRLPPGSTAAAQLPPGSAAAVQLPPGSTSAELLVGERAFAPGPALLDAATAASLQMAVPQLQLHARGSAVVQAWIQVLPTGPLNMCTDGMTAKRGAPKNKLLKERLALALAELWETGVLASTPVELGDKQPFDEQVSVLEQLPQLQGLPSGGALPACAFFASTATLPGFDRNGINSSAAYQLPNKLWVLRATGSLKPLGADAANGIAPRTCWIFLLAVREGDTGQLPPGMLEAAVPGGKLDGTYIPLKGLAYYECAAMAAQPGAGGATAPVGVAGVQPQLDGAQEVAAGMVGTQPRVAGVLDAAAPVGAAGAQSQTAGVQDAGAGVAGMQQQAANAEDVGEGEVAGVQQQATGAQQQQQQQCQPPAAKRQVPTLPALPLGLPALMVALLLLMCIFEPSEPCNATSTVGWLALFRTLLRSLKGPAGDWEPLLQLSAVLESAPPFLHWILFSSQLWDLDAKAKPLTDCQVFYRLRLLHCIRCMVPHSVLLQLLRQRDRYGATVFHRAAACSDVCLVRWLCGEAVPGQPPPLDAADVRCLLVAACTELRTRHRWLPYHEACRFGRADNAAVVLRAMSLGASARRRSSFSCPTSST